MSKRLRLQIKLTLQDADHVSFKALPPSAADTATTLAAAATSSSAPAVGSGAAAVAILKYSIQRSVESDVARRIASALNPSSKASTVTSSVDSSNKKKQTTSTAIIITLTDDDARHVLTQKLDHMHGLVANVLQQSIPEFLEGAAAGGTSSSSQKGSTATATAAAGHNAISGTYTCEPEDVQLYLSMQHFPLVQLPRNLSTSATHMSSGLQNLLQGTSSGRPKDGEDNVDNSGSAATTGTEFGSLEGDVTLFVSTSLEVAPPEVLAKRDKKIQDFLTRLRALSQAKPANDEDVASTFFSFSIYMETKAKTIPRVQVPYFNEEADAAAASPGKEGDAATATASKFTYATPLGKGMSSIDLARTAVRLAPQTAQYWNQLGCTLATDPQHNNNPVASTVRVDDSDDVEYNSKDCFVRAIELKPDYAAPFNNLSFWLLYPPIDWAMGSGASAGGSVYEEEAAAAAPGRQNKQVAAPKPDTRVPFVTLKDGTKINQIDVVRRAIEIDITNSWVFWNNLGFHIPPNRHHYPMLDLAFMSGRNWQTHAVFRDASVFLNPVCGGGDANEFPHWARELTAVPVTAKDDSVMHLSKLDSLVRAMLSKTRNTGNCRNHIATLLLLWYQMYAHCKEAKVRYDASPLAKKKKLEDTEGDEQKEEEAEKSPPSGKQKVENAKDVDEEVVQEFKRELDDLLETVRPHVPFAVATINQKEEEEATQPAAGPEVSRVALLYDPVVASDTTHIMSSTIQRRHKPELVESATILDLLNQNFGSTGKQRPDVAFYCAAILLSYHVTETKDANAKILLNQGEISLEQCLIEAIRAIPHFGKNPDKMNAEATAINASSIGHATQYLLWKNHTQQTEQKKKTEKEKGASCCCLTVDKGNVLTPQALLEMMAGLSIVQCNTACYANYLTLRKAVETHFIE